MARPKATNPKIQRNIYATDELWGRIAALAKDKPVAAFAVELIEAEVARRERMARKSAA